MAGDVADILERLDEGECRAWWLARLHPSGVVCPCCGVSPTRIQLETLGAGGRVRCNSCQKYYDARSETVLTGSKLEYRQLFLIVNLHRLSVSIADISRECQVSDDTVRAWIRMM